jgi:ribose transport system permease protein
MSASRATLPDAPRPRASRGIRWARALLAGAPYLALGVLFAVFGALAPAFFTASNLKHILIQSAPVAIVATGMTFVLLTAGIDLSVGAVMFVAAAILAKLVLAGVPIAAALCVVVVVGVLQGALNALFIVRLGVAPFIVTLATWHFGRGLGLWITQTRAINLPGSILELGTGHVLGIPTPLVVLGMVLPAAHLLLTRTPFGRQVLAVGHDREAARRAGIRTGRVLAAVYMISGACAVIGGMVALGQLGSVSPTFGEKRELEAIAVAVIGGTSLFGGRGNVLPGVLLGSVLIGSIYSGLVILGANPYMYPLVTAGIILVAVLVDSLRAHHLRSLRRRKIRPEGA